MQNVEQYNIPRQLHVKKKVTEHGLQQPARARERDEYVLYLMNQ